jgi:GntR family transcriptional regulator
VEIVIDIEGETPLFTQLMEQVKQAVLSDQIAPGAALPSIRQLANDLDLNNKTVAKAYRLLERDSIIQTKGYRGTFVHPEAKANCSFDMNEWVLSKLSKLIAEFKASSVTDSEIRIGFTQVMNNKDL